MLWLAGRGCRASGRTFYLHMKFSHVPVTYGGFQRWGCFLASVPSLCAGGHHLSPQHHVMNPRTRTWGRALPPIGDDWRGRRETLEVECRGRWLVWTHFWSTQKWRTEVDLRNEKALSKVIQNRCCTPAERSWLAALGDEFASSFSTQNLIITKPFVTSWVLE